ncbi:unnamed protein product [Camellia sinensis]
MKCSRVRKWTLGLSGGKDQIVIIRASGSISRVRGPFNVSGSGITSEQFIEKIRSVAPLEIHEENLIDVEFTKWKYGIGACFLLNVYAPKFETGGTFWPVVHSPAFVFLYQFSLLYSMTIAGNVFYPYSKLILLRFGHQPQGSCFALPNENHVVGAPCGVMDQMTSACGEANKLLAMICQPTEVIGLVAIPSHIRFWGIDSGIRHSIGGADYGSVRVGAFIGRKMIKSIASAMLSQSLSSANGNIDELNEDGVELLQAEASLDYLCNLLPHSCSTNSPRLKMGGTIVKNVGSNLKHCWQIIDMKNGCRDYFSGRIAAGCAREYIYFCYGSIAAVDCVHGPHNPIIRPLNRFWFSELPQIHDYIWSY